MERGSTKMAKQRGISEKGLSQLLESAKSSGKLVDWFPYGQPAPDGVSGAVKVPIKDLGGVIQRLIEIEGLRLQLRVFPYGIPVPDEVLVRFEDGSRRQ